MAGRHWCQPALRGGKVPLCLDHIERLLKYCKPLVAVGIVQLFRPHHEHDIRETGTDEIVTEVKGHRRAGAGSLDAKRAHPGNAQRAQGIFAGNRHFPGHEGLDDIGIDGGVEIAGGNARIGNGFARGLLYQVGMGAVHVAAKRRHADAENIDSAHQIVLSRFCQ